MSAKPFLFCIYQQLYRLDQENYQSTQPTLKEKLRLSQQIGCFAGIVHQKNE